MIRFAKIGPHYSTEQNGTVITFYGTELTSHSTKWNCHHAHSMESNIHYILQNRTVITFYGTEL